MKPALLKSAACCATLAAALLALTGCGASPPAPTAYCPAVAVLQQASALTLFLPGRQDIASQISQAKITGVAGACTLVQKQNVLRVKFQAGFTAVNGPANTSPSLSLPYFVAIAQGDTIVSKADYAITVKFDGNVSSANAATRPITIELPNTPDSAATEILVGFQLTPDELAYAAAHPAMP